MSSGNQTSTRNERLCAKIEGDFVVFLIGMRINRTLSIHKWLPVITAMPNMIRELSTNPELGFLGSEAWFGRTVIMVQYWRSVEQLMAYATNKDAEHLPAWRDFNRNIGNNGAVGIFHETYLISAGAYETIYTNMPPFGLGKAAELVAATGKRQSAGQRLSVSRDQNK